MSPMIKAIRIIAPSSMNVASGLTVKNPEKKVVTRKRMFITHMFFKPFGHFMLRPFSFPVLTPKRTPLWAQSPNMGNGQTMHHALENTGTRTNISMTHQSIHTIIIPKL